MRTYPGVLLQLIDQLDENNLRSPAQLNFCITRSCNFSLPITPVIPDYNFNSTCEDPEVMLSNPRRYCNGKE